MRFAALAVIACCAAATAQDAIVARVGRGTITAADLRGALDDQRRTGNPEIVMNTFTTSGRRETLQALVDARLLADGARDARLDDDADVKRAIARAVDRALADQLTRRELATVDVSAAALRRYYDDHDAAFRTGGRVKARHIVVASEAEAKAALEALKQGRDFGELAAELNVDASKGERGELGWVRRGVMVKPFEEVLFALAAGQTSGIVQTSFGYHVIQCEEVDPGTRLPFESVQAQIRQRLFDERVDALKRRLTAAHPVSIDEHAAAEAVK